MGAFMQVGHLTALFPLFQLHVQLLSTCYAPKLHCHLPIMSILDDKSHEYIP
jgi:hypothetical protein